MAFFDLAKDAGFTVTKTFEKVMDKVMFEEDPGVSEKRSPEMLIGRGRSDDVLMC